MIDGIADLPILRRGDDAYERARQAAIWNGKKPDRFPDAIIVAAVRLADAEGWTIGGGASFTGCMDGPAYVYTVDVLGEFLDWILPVTLAAPENVANLWAAIESFLPFHQGTVIAHFPIAFADTDEEADADAEDEPLDAFVRDAMRSLEPYSIRGGKVNDHDLVSFPKYVIGPGPAS